MTVSVDADTHMRKTLEMSANCANYGWGVPDRNSIENKPRGVWVQVSSADLHQIKSRSTNGCVWGGCRKFVPVLGGDGTKKASPGDIFNQPLVEMS